MGYIAIVDYGAGNLMSVHNTLDYLGYENKIAASADVIENAAGVILPGVGAFPDAMAALRHSGLTLHLKSEYGENAHHITEALFKALARALRQAVALTGGGVLSAKGVL